MRIIAERNGPNRWWAWWEDEPHYRTRCTSRFGAVDKLLKRANCQMLAVENLSIDVQASRDDHVEMLVKVNGWEE